MYVLLAMLPVCFFHDVCPTKAATMDNWTDKVFDEVVSQLILKYKHTTFNTELGLYWLSIRDGMLIRKVRLPAQNWAPRIDKIGENHLVTTDEDMLILATIKGRNLLAEDCEVACSWNDKQLDKQLVTAVVGEMLPEMGTEAVQV